MKKLTKEQRTKFLKEQQEDRAEHNGHRRKLNTHFLFWTVCQDKACARARGCAGADADGCFMRWWPEVPEEIKVEFRACIVGVAQKGMSIEEATAYAQAEVARWKADQERWARDNEEQNAEAVVRAPEKASKHAPVNVPMNAPANGPRVRSL